MAEVTKVTDQYVIAQANTIRQQKSTSDGLKKSAYKIGAEIGKKIIEKYFLKKETIITPEGCAVEANIPEIPLSVIVTTKDDLKYFGQGLAISLENCKQGYMDFEGRKGFEALNHPIREIELPLIKNGAPDELREDGMLIPGIGHLDDRIKGKK